MARLSVNLNKIALLRNSRRTGVPDLLHFASLALDAGAKGLTVHPRPDERHIRATDVPLLSELMRSRRPAFELNIEGYPDQRLLDILHNNRPEQATLVPDAPEALTSEEGWMLDATQTAFAARAVAAIKQLGCRVILFIDPDPTVIERVTETGADGVEIFTGHYAGSFRVGRHQLMLNQIAATARQAQAAGLLVNVGHDLNLGNIPPLMANVPFLAEASVGHELTADALDHGFAPTIAAYVRALQ